MIIRSRRKNVSRRGGVNPIFVLVVITVMLLLLTNFILHLSDSVLRPMVEGVGVESAKAIANRSVMLAVEEELTLNGVEYADLVTVETSDTGEVRALVSDIVGINQLKSRVSERVQENLKVDVIRLSVPLGNLIAGELLSGRGPEIDLRLIPYGSVVVDIENEFTSAGINQTLHRIILNVNTGVSIMMPVSNVSTNVVTSICVAETVIVGRVPEYYTNITDLPDDLGESLMNFPNPVPYD